VNLNPPRRGEHTHEVLRAIGFEPAEIDVLVERRAVA
jgi:crotonobetainyl-CoA:carnitine CoA-transferase CaiB-like acyl-CoA transferase